MLATILNSFKVAEIRKKLLFTAALLALYRLGSFIPVPGVSTDALKQLEDLMIEEIAPDHGAACWATRMGELPRAAASSVDG